MNYLGKITETGDLLLKTPKEEQSSCWNGKNIALCTISIAGAGGCSMPLLPYAATFLGIQLPNWVLGVYGVGIGCINCMAASYLCCHSDDKTMDKEKIEAFIKYNDQTVENLKLRENLQETNNKLLSLEKDREEAIADRDSLRERYTQLDLRVNQLIEKQNGALEKNQPKENPQTSYFGGIINYFW